MGLRAETWVRPACGERVGEVATSSAEGGKESAEKGGGEGAEQRVEDDGAS